MRSHIVDGRGTVLEHVSDEHPATVKDGMFSEGFEMLVSFEFATFAFGQSAVVGGLVGGW